MLSICLLALAVSAPTDHLINQLADPSYAVRQQAEVEILSSYSDDEFHGYYTSLRITSLTHPHSQVRASSDRLAQILMNRVATSMGEMPSVDMIWCDPVTGRVAEIENVARRTRDGAWYTGKPRLFSYERLCYEVVYVYYLAPRTQIPDYVAVVKNGTKHWVNQGYFLATKALVEDMLAVGFSVNFVRGFVDELRRRSDLHYGTKTDDEETYSDD